MDAFELEEPQSLHDLLLLNTSPIPCVVTKSEEHRFHVLPLLDLALRHWLLHGTARTRRRYVEPSRRLTSPPCICSRGTNHMPNVRQAPVPSEPHPHHLILCTVLYMFMCVTVRSKSLSWAACVDKLA